MVSVYMSVKYKVLQNYPCVSSAVKYTVEADRTQRNPRVKFVDNKLNTYTDILTFSSPTCQELKLRVNVRDT